MFFVTFMALFLGTSFYIALRFYQGVSPLCQGISFWWVAGVFFLLTAVLIMGFARSLLPFPEGLKRFFGSAGCIYMGIFIYLLVYTALADIVMLVPRLMQLGFTTHRYFKTFLTGSVLLLTCITCVYGFVHARQINRVEYNVEIAGKQDISDLNIVLLSDLHLGALGSESRLADIVEAINEQKPDVVCISGDLFDSDFSSIRDPDAAIATLQGIRSTYGVYACLGNHDAGKTAGQMVSFLEKANIALLGDTYTVIDNRLILAGRLDRSPIGGYTAMEQKALPENFGDVDPSMPVIMLDHNPADVNSYGSDVDLILCGHTHKGQLFPGSVFTDMMYDVDYGYYRKDSNSPHVIVTSGIGYWGMPMRVGSDCELVTIRFE